MRITLTEKLALANNEISVLRTDLGETVRQLADLRAKNLALATENEGLTTMLQGRAQQTAARGDRATRMLIIKRLAITLCATVRWDNTNGFEYRAPSGWVVVPNHTLAFVMNGIQA